MTAVEASEVQRVINDVVLVQKSPLKGARRNSCTSRSACFGWCMQAEWRFLTNANCMRPGALSAQAIYEKEAKTRKIVTFCQELDAALGGGIATGQVTELCK